MAEYIERENAYKLIHEQKEKETGMYSKGRNRGLNVAKSIIHDKGQCPTVDVVKVVRCEKCKYCQVIYPLEEISKESEKVYYCNLLEFTTAPTNYCNYGELKEREG